MSNNSLIPAQDELKAIEFMAKNAVESKYVEKLGGYAGVVSIAMYARELGIPIMSALFGGMANIMGKITIAPQLMNAMIRKAGHKLEIDSNDARCVIKGIRNDTGEFCTVSFSVEEAKKAGLFKTGGGWDKYPSDMCFARSLSRLARRLFPDVIGMAYVEGEIPEDDKKETKKEKLGEKGLLDAEISFEKVQSLDDIKKEFLEKFAALETEPGQLQKYIDSRNDLPKSLIEALKDPEGFSMFFKKQLKKKEVVKVPVEMSEMPKSLDDMN